MECPICTSTMEEGKLFGDTYSLKWLSGNKKLFLNTWAFGADNIDNRDFTSIEGRPYASGYKCVNCRKIYINNTFNTKPKITFLKLITAMLKRFFNKIKTMKR